MQDHGLGYLRRRRSSHEGVAVNLAVEDTLVEEQKRFGDEARSCERVEVETQVVVPLQACGVGYAEGQVGGRKKAPDSGNGEELTPKM